MEGEVASELEQVAFVVFGKWGQDLDLVVEGQLGGAFEAAQEGWARIRERVSF